MKGSARKKAESTPNLPDSRGSFDDSQQAVTFWGVRGTLPTPGTSTLKYGGNTSCVEVSYRDGPGNAKLSLILDAGTGIAKFGDYALQRGDREFHVLLSHMHYDHIIGLTRFAPLFRADCKVRIYGQAKGGKSLKEIFKTFFSFPFFPLEFDMLPCRRDLKFFEINDLEEFQIGEIKVGVQGLNHPQQAVAFRVFGRKDQTSVVYATDHEHGTDTDAALTQFASGASLLLYDTTYSELAYPNHIGWGHSTARHGALIARDAEVGAFGLFHHDPFATDEQLEQALLPEARKVFERSFLCAENQTLVLSTVANMFERAAPPCQAVPMRGVRAKRMRMG